MINENSDNILIEENKKTTKIIKSKKPKKTEEEKKASKKEYQKKYMKEYMRKYYNNNDEYKKKENEKSKDRYYIKKAFDYINKFVINKEDGLYTKWYNENNIIKEDEKGNKIYMMRQLQPATLMHFDDMVKNNELIYDEKVNKWTYSYANPQELYSFIKDAQLFNRDNVNF